jgi:core-2/I-Branching enzyme
MKHGFLILTHFPPEKIYNQVRRLQHPDHYFYIHFNVRLKIDSEDPFYKQLIALPHVVVLTERVGVQWGGIKILDAILLLIREGLKNKEISYFHLISGECMHVKPIGYIHEYFEKNKGKEFIDQFRMPETGSGHFNYNRLNKYHLHDFFDLKSKKTKDWFLKSVNSGFRKLQRLLKVVGIYRRYSSKLPVLHAGAMWWSLSYEACAYISEYERQHPELYKRFAYVQLPDEIFFHTIIMNGPFKDKVTGINLRFTDFKGAIGHPHELTMKYLPELTKPDILFARKFTPASVELQEYLDKHVY